MVNIIMSLLYSIADDDDLSLHDSEEGSHDDLSSLDDS